jgi:hypothetical protein
VDDPLADRAWRAHLFRTRSEEQVARWARSLRYFRFCRGRPAPFFTEPDRLVVALRSDGASDRRQLLDALGADDGPDGFRDLTGGRARVDARPDRLLLSVSGVEQRRTELTDRDVEVASAIEEVIDAVADRVIDPPFDDRSCVSPAHYPALFAATP